MSLSLAVIVLKLMKNSAGRDENSLRIHKNQEELMEDIPKEVVPPEYGGTGPSIPELTEYWVGKFKQYHDWMKVEEQLGTDESKRLGPPVAHDFMEDGSFRKLDID